MLDRTPQQQQKQTPLKQKIVLEVLMHNEKCRTKAMKIAAAAEGKTSSIPTISRTSRTIRLWPGGVMSVALEGPANDRMVVVGVGIGSATSASSLSKRVGLTSFVSISEVKPEDAKKKEGNVDNCSCAHTASSTAWGHPSTYTYPSHSFAPFHPGYDVGCLNSEPPSICSVVWFWDRFCIQFGGLNSFTFESQQ